MINSIQRWVAVGVLALGLMAPATAQIDLTDNLVIYYDFEETTGAVLNDTAPDATPTNADVVGFDMASTASVTGKIGNAYHSPKDELNFAAIDGTPGNAARDASLPTDLHFGTGDYSVSCWTYYPDASSGNEVIWGNINWNGTRDGTTLFRNTNDSIMGSYGDGANSRHTRTGFRSAGEWHHWVLVGNRGTTTSVAYHNGVEIASGTLTPNDIGDPAVPWVFGTNPVLGGSIKGVNAYYDDFAVWHRALSAVEAARIYALGNASTPMGALAGADDPWLVVTFPTFTAQPNLAGSQQITVQIDNPGTVDAEITAISVDKGAFASDTVTVSGASFPLTVTAGTTTSVTLTWDPASGVGTRDFALNITSDDPALPAAIPINGASVIPETLAWWRFENGTVDTLFPDTAGATTYATAVPDMSGNGNHLAAFNDSAANAFARSFVPPYVTAAGSNDNMFSAENSGNGPSLFTWSEMSTPAVDLESLVLGEWTIEAFIYPRTITGQNRGIVGRDGFGRAGGSNSSPLYFNIQGSGALIVEYYDEGDQAHFAGTAAGTIVTNNWYYVATQCDGTTLSLYMADLTAGETEPTLVASVSVAGSPDPDFGPMPDPSPTGNTNPRPRASWTVMRQYWNHGDVDRYIGNIDEVKISGTALDIATEGLLSVGVPVELGSFELE